MSDENTAESEPSQESGVDLLQEISSELIPEAVEQKAVGENPKPTELAETEEKSQSEPTAKVDPVIQQSIDKRIAKEVRKRKELESELEKEKAKSNALESQYKGAGEIPKTSVELSDMTPAELDQADKEAREYMVWAMNGPMENGYETTDANGESKFYEPEEIKEIYQHYHQKAMLDIPDAKNQKSTVANKLNNLALDNPVLQDEDSIEYQEFKKVWTSADFKALRNTPQGADYAWAIAKGNLSEGLKKPTFIPKSPTALAPKVPVAPAPSRAKPMQSQSKTNELTEQDYANAGAGNIDDAVAKLLS